MSDTKPKPFCFVLMPFDKSFDDIYALGIKDSCLDAGAYCERVDEQIYKERILDRIYNQIAKADFVVADMTGRNPNVFYEVGYAHAIGKNTILITQNSEDIPFDLKHFPHIIYNNKIVELKKELTKRIKWFIQNPDVKAENKLAIEVYGNGLNLSRNDVVFDKKFNGDSVSFDLSLTFYNDSTISFQEGDFKVGLIFSDKFSYILNSVSKGVKKITLPDNRFICMLPYFETIFPSAYAAYSVNITYKRPFGLEEIIIRLFSDVGSRDYGFKINFIDTSQQL